MPGTSTPDSGEIPDKTGQAPLISGKFARAQLRPIRQKPHQRVYNDQLSKHDRRTFERRKAIIADFAHRIAAPLKPVADWVIYTDAATNPPIVCALLFNIKSRTTPLLKERTACFPVTWPYLFAGKPSSMALSC